MHFYFLPDILSQQ